MLHCEGRTCFFVVQAQETLEMQKLALEVQRSERAAAAITKSRLTAHQMRLKALEWDHEVSCCLIA